MKCFVLYWCLILYVSDVARAILPPTTNISDIWTQPVVDYHQELTYADVLRERIKEREWEEDELPCLNTILETLNGTKNFTLWAVWMVDSMQLPIGQLYGSNYHVGNYDECMNPPWLKTHPEFKTQYCVTNLQLIRSSKNKDLIIDPKSSAEVYIKTRTKHDRDLGRMTWGTCVPEACKPAAIIKIFRTLLKVSHLGHFSEEADISISSCEIAGTPKQVPKEYYILVWASVIMLLFVCLSTYYTKLYYKPEAKSYFQETIRSFCIRRNINSLKNVRDDEIHIIHMMKLVSSVIVTGGHLFFVSYGGMVVNGLNIEKDIENGLGYLNHQDYVVDSFFAISGLLLVRGFFNGNWTNPFKFLTKRYLRITTSLALIIYIKTNLFYYMSDGPLWPKLAGSEQEFCRKTWWHNLAFTSNYFTGSEGCYVISWSLPVDFHMTIVGVILGSIYRKSKRLAISAFWILFTVAVVISGWISYINKLPLMSFTGIESLVNYRENILLVSTYVTTHTRAGSFLVGIALGYIIAHYNPSKYRNIISKKLSYFLIMMSLIVMGGIVVIAYNLYLEPNRLGIAVFTSISRNLWATMVAIIIAVCEYGDLGDFMAIINWPPFVPLSRLTFGVYLIHMLLIERNVMSVRTPARWDQLSMFEESLGIFLVSFIGSFILWLTVEAPTVNLASLLLDGTKTKTSKETIKTHVSEEKLKAQ